MKDPIEEYEKQHQRLDEIFGWLNRTFGPKPRTTPSSFLDAMSRYKDSDTDTDCLGMNVGNKLNRKVAATTGTASVTIGKNTIKNIKGLRFELLNRKGRGTGKFDNAIVNDFKCYDLVKDIYGIKWLFDDNASYEAESITGDLKAGVKNQSVAFFGKWNAGIFQGKFMSDSKDFGPGSIVGTSATFAFGSPVKNTRKKTTKAPVTQTTTTGKTIPKPIGTVAPTRTSMSPTATVNPAPVTSAAPAATSTAGKKSGGGKGRNPITIKEFLSKFM